MSDAKLLLCPPVNLLASKGDPSEDMTAFNSLFFFTDLSYFGAHQLLFVSVNVFSTQD